MATDQETIKRITNHLADQNSDEERQEFEQWLLQASEDEKEQYAKATKLWDKTALEKGSFQPNPEQGWKQVQQKISFRSNNRRSWPTLKIAAAIALLISIGSIITMITGGSKQVVVSTSPSEDVKELTLPDGSQIWLNKSSTLTYSSEFDIDQRKVYLQGEAFFEISKVDGKGFSVLTNSTITNVLGTSFNITALPDKPVIIQVETGKVAFSDLKESAKVLLTPGEKAVYYGKQKEPIITSKIKDLNYRSWQNKKLTFQNTSLLKIAETLEDYFQTKILVQKNLESCRFSVSFDQPQIQEVLDVLALTGGLKVTANNQGYEVSGKGCN